MNETNAKNVKKVKNVDSRGGKVGTYLGIVDVKKKRRRN